MKVAILFVVGSSLLSYGLFLITPAASFMFGGILLIAMAFANCTKEEEKSNESESSNEINLKAKTNKESNSSKKTSTKKI